MEYEEYVDVKKDNLKGLTYDQIHNYLKSSKKEERLKLTNSYCQFAKYVTNQKINIISS